MDYRTTFDERKETIFDQGANGGRQSGESKTNRRNEKNFQDRHTDSEEDYQKGLIVSFTAKKIGALDESEKKADDEKVVEGEKPSEIESGDEEKLSREDIKGALAKFGVIRVGSPHPCSPADCNPCYIYYCSHSVISLFIWISVICASLLLLLM